MCWTESEVMIKAKPKKILRGPDVLEDSIRKDIQEIGNYTMRMRI